MELKIRKAEESDARLMSDISVMSTMCDRKDGFFMSHGTPEEYLERILSDKWICLVADSVEAKCVGYILLNDNPPKHLLSQIPDKYSAYKYIYALGVHPLFKKMGIGTELKAYVKTIDCISMVYTHPLCNEPSLKMNRSAGYLALEGLVEDDDIPGNYCTVFISN